jgi:hypothetical protein
MLIIDIKYFLFGPLDPKNRPAPAKRRQPEKFTAPAQVTTFDPNTLSETRAHAQLRQTLNERIAAVVWPL